MAEELRTIFNAPDRHIAETYLAKTVQKYAQSLPASADWLEKNIPEGLTVCSFQILSPTVANHQRPGASQPRNQAPHSGGQYFSNEAACLRLISAVLMEIEEAWQIDRI